MADHARLEHCDSLQRFCLSTKREMHISRAAFVSPRHDSCSASGRYVAFMHVSKHDAVWGKSAIQSLRSQPANCSSTQWSSAAYLCSVFRADRADHDVTCHDKLSYHGGITPGYSYALVRI